MPTLIDVIIIVASAMATICLARLLRLYRDRNKHPVRKPITKAEESIITVLCAIILYGLISSSNTQYRLTEFTIAILITCIYILWRDVLKITHRDYIHNLRLIPRLLAIILIVSAATVLTYLDCCVIETRDISETNWHTVSTLTPVAYESGKTIKHSGQGTYVYQKSAGKQVSVDNPLILTTSKNSAYIEEQVATHTCTQQWFSLFLQNKRTVIYAPPNSIE